MEDIGVLVKVGTQGRIVLPEKYRDVLGLKEGDYIYIKIVKVERREKK